MKERTRHVPGLGIIPQASEFERARRMALDVLRVDPEAKRKVEDAFGVAYCQDRWPELYGINRQPRIYEPSRIHDDYTS